MFLRLTLLASLLIVVASTRTAKASDGPVYELRTYTCAPGKLAPLHARFREHTMKIFEKHGMKNVAYWTPTEGETAGITLVYLLEHESRQAAQRSWDGFRNDPEWKQVAAQSAADHGKILAKPPEKTYMVVNDYSPAIGPVDPSKTYELRIYTTHPGKLDPLNARFRGGEVDIFHRLGMKSVGYWTPLDETESKNTLIYMLQHDSRDAARASWKAFGRDPEWKQMRAESEQDGTFLSKRPESTFLKTTDYSPLPAK